MNTIYVMGERSLNGHPEAICEGFLNMRCILKTTVIMSDMPGSLSDGLLERWNPVSEANKARWPFIEVGDEWSDKRWCQIRRGEFLKRVFLKYPTLHCLVNVFYFGF